MPEFLGIGLPELITILIIAGIVMGPERMGQAARWLGKTTAQLQNISRGFVAQLNAELDAADEGGELKAAMKEIGELRKQIGDLRTEIGSVASSTIDESKQRFDGVERTIHSPTISSEAEESGGEENGRLPTPPPVPPPPTELPNLIDIPDDPES